MLSVSERTIAAPVRLLLVDDHPAGLAARTSVLSELGFAITTATSAEVALEKFCAEPFPLVVTDYKLPGKTGVDLIAGIRAVAPETRIVLISGFVDALGLTEHSTGADAVLTKSANEVTQLIRAGEPVVAALGGEEAGERTESNGKEDRHGGVMRRAATWVTLCAAVFIAAQGAPPPVAKKKAAAVKPAAAKPVAALPVTESAIAERWLQGMTLRQRVAQLVVIRTHGNMASARGREWRNIVRWVRDSQVGGIIVVNRVRRGAVVKAEPYETVQFVNRLQKLARLPLLVGGDFERSVSMRFDGTIQYPHAMAYGAAGRPELTEEFGRITVRESRALGFQWVFAPDADVNSNPDNPIIGIRAFGVDPATVSAHVQAFLRGANGATAGKALLTVKHFPGHGDTAADSHAGMPVVASDRARLDALELAPFRAAIASGVDSVMSAHISLPAVDATNVPSTISKVVIGDVLKKDLGFKGIVTTDAMDMEGLAKEYGSAESSVRAIEAGVDVLLMPRDPDQAIEAVVKAVLGKRLTAARINESVRKVLRAKVRLGLHKGRLTDGDAIADVMEDEGSMVHAQKVADAAVAVLRGDRKRLPVANDATTCVLALTERRGNGQGAQLSDELKARLPQARLVMLDPLMPEAALSAGPEGCATTVVAAYLGFGGTGKLNTAYGPLLERLAGAGKPVVVAALGNPFLVRAYPGAALALTTYSTVPVSETALVKVLAGEMAATGKAFLPE